MLRVTKSVAAILLGLGLVGILPTAVIAWNATCDQFEVCVWKHGPFGSPKAADSDTEWDYTPDHYPNTTEDINDSVSSIRNLKPGSTEALTG